MPNGKPPVVVVIAASAGGVQALMTLCRSLPADFQAPIVVVQHRPVESILAHVLQRVSTLPVSDAVAGERLRAGHVYLSRPDRHLTITAEGRFAYVNGHRIRHVLSSANPLFETAARAFGSGAIGVVLTGGNRDGTDGVHAIKQCGGTVIAQDAPTSQHYHMPASAIATLAVDYILPLERIAPELVRLVEQQGRLLGAVT